MPQTCKAHLSELQLAARLERWRPLWWLRAIACCCCRDSTLGEMEPRDGWSSVLLRSRRYSDDPLPPRTTVILDVTGDRHVMWAQQNGDVC